MEQKKTIMILSVLLAIAVFIIGIFCGGIIFNNKKYDVIEDKQTNINTNTDIVEKNGDDSDEEIVDIVEKSDVDDTSQIMYSEKDKNVISEVENIEEVTTRMLEEEKDDKTVAQKAKGVFISLVDFIFYDGEIKGVTFNELTESGKEKILKMVQSIDSKIEKRFPGYKEAISSKASTAFNKASEVIKVGASNISDFSREKLGEENYNSIIESKDELVSYTKIASSIVKNVGGNIFSKVKSKIKNWYEQFRENNN